MKEMERDEEEEEETAGYLSCPFCHTVQPVLCSVRSSQHLDLQQKAGAKRGHGLVRVLFSPGWEMLESE